MTGVSDLEQLLRSLQPRLMDEAYVFCSLAGHAQEYMALNPVAYFREAEGLTLVVEKQLAQQAGLVFEGVYRQITLTVHSSLEAVGLTAAVAGRLAQEGISANVIAAYYHDHIFVPAEKAQQALTALQSLAHTS